MTGQPRRHLLQSGWSHFVSSKKLVAGDAFIFLRFTIFFIFNPVSKIVNPVKLFICSISDYRLYHFASRVCDISICYFNNRSFVSDQFVEPFTFRGETGELRVGVRRAMRHASNIPSSVISSHSMHIGVLATAWHAVKTGTMFTVYYKPRYLILINIHFFVE